MLGVQYRFGSKPVPPAPVPEPAPVVVPPAPPPPAPPAPCTAGSDGEALSLAGCKAGDSLVLHGVNFEFDQDRLTANAQVLLDQVASELGSHPTIKVEIACHTDSKGSDSYNQKLSQSRATAVLDYLLGKGIDASRMTAQGFGESMPVADNQTDEGREQNRRVELKIVDAGPAPESAPAVDEPPAAGGAETPAATP